MIWFHNRRPKKVADNLVAFVIMPRPRRIRETLACCGLPKQKATIKSANVNNILIKRNLISDPTNLPNHSSPLHLTYCTLRLKKTVREWHPEPPRQVGLVAGLHNSNSFSSVYSISPLISIATDLCLGESAVGKVSSSLPTIYQLCSGPNTSSQSSLVLRFVKDQ